MVGRLFLAVPRGCLQFVIVVFPDHTHLLFLYYFLRHDKVCQDSVKITNSDNIDRTFLQEPSDLVLLFAQA